MQTDRRAELVSWNIVKVLISLYLHLFDNCSPIYHPKALKAPKTIKCFKCPSSSLYSYLIMSWYLVIQTFSLISLIIFTRQIFAFTFNLIFFLWVCLGEIFIVSVSVHISNNQPDCQLTVKLLRSCDTDLCFPGLVWRIWEKR